MTLRTKTAALLAAIVGAALATAGVVWLRSQEHALERTVVEGLDGQARIAAHGIGAFVDEGLSDARAVALTFPAEALAAGRLPEIEAHLDRMRSMFPGFQDGIWVIDAQGRFVTDAPRHAELRGESFATAEYFQRTLRGQRGILGEPHRSRRTGRSVVTFTAPVRDSAGEIVAVVACAADLLSHETLSGYRRQKLGETGSLSVFDGSRRWVLHPADDRLLTQVQEGKGSILDAALRGSEGAGETVSASGVPMLVAVRRIRNAPWFVAVQVSRQEGYAPIVSARGRIAGSALAVLLLIVLVGGLAIRGISRPLAQLERAASEISVELDGATREPHQAADHALQSLRLIRSGDEIGALASSFLRLAEKLRSTLRSVQESADAWERTFDSVKEAVVTVDPDGRIRRMNRTAQSWFRTSASLAGGLPVHVALTGADAVPAEWPQFATLREQRTVRWSADIEGSRRILEITVTPIRHETGPEGAVLVMSDITERVESEERIREMAFYDHLTGLPNRFLLQDRLQQAIASAARSEEKAAVMFIDLDRFKEINDVHGHDVGDDVLREVVRRIASCVRRNDTVSRLGGDEFVVILQPVESRREAGATAERILAAQAAPLVLGGVDLSIRASIGIALFPDDAQDGETLLKAADEAMYRAKRQGRNKYQHFRYTLEDVGA